MAYLKPHFHIGINVTFALLLLFCTFATAAETLPAPEQAVQDVSESLKTLLKENRARIKIDRAYVYQLANEVLAPHIDFHRLSGLALGKHWRRASSAQKEEFMQQFQRLLVRTYSTAFREFGDWSLHFIPRHNTTEAKNIMVRSEILRSDAPPISVNYRMHKKENDWLVYDVVIEGISLVTNYRSTFSKEVRRNGMKGLIKRITKLNNRRTAIPQQASR